MKLGLGLYRSLLTDDNFRFARQAGATHIVAHIVGNFSRDRRNITTGSAGFGLADGDRDFIWTLEGMQQLKAAVNAEGLQLEAIENFDPTHWYDVLLDGPKKHAQMEHLKQIIRNVGKVGIPVFGYNFSIAGVWGREEGAYARGGAKSVAFLEPDQPPIPNGMVWNMVYDPEAPAGSLGKVTSEELWQRASWFLSELLPVAEEAGVKLAAHPDDPPMPELRGTARLVYEANLYDRLLALRTSPNSMLEFCLGTLGEMKDTDIYQAVDKYSAMGKIAYIHFRNVRGKVPRYYEVFIDEGDVDMIRILKILRDNHYQGVLIPDHTPKLECDAPWHAGMAYALGYMRGAMRVLGIEIYSGA
jgi:mannonate dehydratase